MKKSCLSNSDSYDANHHKQHKFTSKTMLHDVIHFGDTYQGVSEKESYEEQHHSFTGDIKIDASEEQTIGIPSSKRLCTSKKSIDLLHGSDVSRKMSSGGIQFLHNADKPTGSVNSDVISDDHDVSFIPSGEEDITWSDDKDDCEMVDDYRNSRRNEDQRHPGGDNQKTESLFCDNIFSQISVENAKEKATDTGRKPHPAELHLLHLMKEFSLPTKAYAMFMGWAKSAVDSGFDFTTFQGYNATVTKMMSQGTGGHMKVSSTVVQVGKFPPHKVFHFPFLPNIERLVSDKHLMEGSLWCCNKESEVCSELNTGDWWKGAQDMLSLRFK